MSKRLIGHQLRRNIYMICLVIFLVQTCNRADIVFVLDSSGSVTNTSWIDTKIWLNTLLQDPRMSMDEDSIRVGMSRTTLMISISLYKVILFSFTKERLKLLKILDYNVNDNHCAKYLLRNVKK